MMEQLIRLFTDRYLTREEVMYRLPVSMPISRFWPALEKARRSATIELPLNTQSGTPFRFVLNKSIEEQCDAVADLARRESFSDILPEELIIDATIEEAVWSSMIEGAFTSKAEATKLIRQDKAPANKSEQMVKNNYRALRYVLEHLEEPITEQTLIDIASIVTKDASDAQVTGFRDGQVFVTGKDGIVYTPPAADKVPYMIRELIDFIKNSELHPLLKACIAHFTLVYIHPFEDGNGRTARALSYMMLLKTGYDFFRYFSISGIIAEERSSYYKSMRAVEEADGDMTYFIDFYSAMMKRSVERMEQQLLCHVRADKTIAALEKKGTLNERQLKGARWILESGHTSVTVDAWKKKFGIATETARQDLLLLCEEGLAERTTEGRKAIFVIQRG